MLSEEFDFKDERVLLKGCEEPCHPHVTHTDTKGQPPGSSMHVIDNLSITDVKQTLCFYPPCREDCGSTVDFKLVFGVVQNLNPSGALPGEGLSSR